MTLSNFRVKIYFNNAAKKSIPRQKDFYTFVYMVRITKIICILLCCAALLGTTGCAYHSTNPVVRYASYGGTYGAVPGVICLAAAAAVTDSDDEDNDSSDDLALLGLALTGIGYIGGAVIGGTVGLFRWMILGDFEPNNRDDGLPPELYDGTIKVSPKYRNENQETGPSPWDLPPNQ